MDQCSSYSLQLPSSSNSSTHSSASSALRQQLQYHLQQQQRLHQQQLYDTLSCHRYFSDGSSPTRTTPQTSTSASDSASWLPHRNEVHPSQQSQLFFLRHPEHHQQEPVVVKRESNMTERVSNGSTLRNSDDPMPSTSDFVKKLYKMLEDPAFQSVVCWGPEGDCFVVKDMNEFTKSILPRMFKHSNFASFVRQLNKYDFHKVKNTDDNQFGEHSWTFRHPDFHADRRDALENIKRKVPAGRKSQPSSTHPLSSHPYSASGRGRSSSPTSVVHHAPLLAGVHNSSFGLSPPVTVLQAEIQRLREEGDDLRGRLRSLERNYENILVEMVSFQRGMAQQDGLMQNLISYFLGTESAKLKTSQQSGAQDLRNNSSPLSPSVIQASTSDAETAGVPSGFTAVTEQLHAQLKLHQAQHERAQALLKAQLNEVLRDRERNEVERMAEQRQRSSSVTRFQELQQIPSSAQREGLRNQSSASTAATTTPPLSPSLYGGPRNDLALLSDTTNPFLPPQVYQRIVVGSSTPTQGGTPFSPDGGELGRATLLQMNELSRRVADRKANGRNVNFWDDFVPDQQQGQYRTTLSDQEETSRGEALAETRHLLRESVTQGGWPNLSLGVEADPGLNSRTGAPGELMRNVNEEESRRAGFDISMARDDTSMDIGNQRSESQELLDDIGRTSRKRQRTSIAFHANAASAPSEEIPTAESSADYAMSLQSAQIPPPALSVQDQARSTSMGAASVASSQFCGQSKKQNGSLNLWASLISGQSFLDVLESSSEEGLGGSSSGGGMRSGSDVGFRAEEDGSLAHEGLQVYTVGHLLPRGVGMSGSEDLHGWWAVESKTGQENGDVYGNPSASGSSAQGQQPQRQAYGGDATSGNQFAALVNREGGNGEGDVVQPTPSRSLINRGAAAMSSSFDSPGSQKLRVRRSTYVPGWAVPPRVLLVDDDAVSRKLSSKFLKVFGCTIDVAVDGVGAVNKMNLEKYDLVLMDIVMPKLDGVSATSLIRKFDQGTPIISMTSNSKPNEIMTYYSSGMNDILPKPFSKEGLLEMLEKHLMHLKVIQQMSRLPRTIAGPSSIMTLGSGYTTNTRDLQGGASSSSFVRSAQPVSGAVMSSSSSDATLVENLSSPFNLVNTDDGRINFLAGMGLTDEQYSMILQNLVNEDGLPGAMDESISSIEKRPLEEPGDDGRNGKRSRFEVIE